MTAVLTAAAFASGGGTNFQALLDHRPASPSYRIRLLVTDRPGIGAIERAEAAGVTVRTIPTKDRAPEDVARDTLAALEAHGVQAIFLCGYLKLLPPEVIGRFRGRILNVHPALLPAFGGKGMYGLHVHRAVLAAGARVSGPTVHLVDEEYDSGAILAQWPVPVLPGDTPEALAARVLAAEHALFPETAEHVCRALAEGRTPGPWAPAGDAFVLSGSRTTNEHTRE